MAEIGAHRAAVVDADGDAWDDAGNVSTDALVTITTNLSRTAHITTRRSGLGALRGVTLESSGGALVLRRGQDVEQHRRSREPGLEALADRSGSAPAVARQEGVEETLGEGRDEGLLAAGRGVP